MNFAISQRDGKPGVQHLGIQVEDRSELAEVYERLQRTEGPVIEKGAMTCCYANSEKSGVDDPQGLQWETFRALGESTVYGTDEIRSLQEKRKAEAPCCGPSCGPPAPA